MCNYKKYMWNLLFLYIFNAFLAEKGWGILIYILKKAK